MSKSKGESNRKRQNDETEDGAPKKSKKAKQINDAVAAESPAAPVIAGEAVTAPQKERKPKKQKKSKLSNDETDHVKNESTTNGASNHKSDSTAMGDIDEAMPNAHGDAVPAITSKKSKKEKKEKKSKKAEAVSDNTEEQAPEASEGADVDMVDIETVTLDKSARKERKQRKKDKKVGKVADGSEPPQLERQNGDMASNSTNGATEREAPVSKNSSKEKKRKSKKDKKANKEDGEGLTEAAAESTGVAEEEAETSERSDAPIDVADAKVDTEAQPEADGEGAEKKSRFIVFVGNLPYSATREQIEAHFEKLKPFELRMRTYKGKKDGGFMGTCFIEFPRFDRMQTALQKYHHSVFSNGIGPKNERKINVELSAGGGGNNPARMEKIKAKNEKLANERQRIHEKRDEIETKQKERKEKKAAKGINGAGAKAETEQEEPSQENNGMHPSRLAMLNKQAPAWKGRQRF